MPAIDMIHGGAIGTINPNLYGHVVEQPGSFVYEGAWKGTESAIANTGGVCSNVETMLSHPEMTAHPADGTRLSTATGVCV